MKVLTRRCFLKAPVVAAIAVTTGLPGCTGPASPKKSSATTHRVEIRDFAFQPASLTIAPGDTVTWINRDIVPHTATAEDQSWDTGSLDSNRSGSVVFTAGMSGAYFCRFHPAMRAELRINLSDGY